MPRVVWSVFTDYWGYGGPAIGTYESKEVAREQGEAWAAHAADRCSVFDLKHWRSRVWVQRGYLNSRQPWDDKETYTLGDNPGDPLRCD